jgi:ABC-type amino acid transport system permease subunit
MYVFWWTGRGFWAILSLVLTLFVFGVVNEIARPILGNTNWWFGLGFIAAGAINWKLGRHYNRRQISTNFSSKTIERIFYRARHKFMSLPFELWSLPMVLCGIAFIAKDIVSAISPA